MATVNTNSIATTTLMFVAALLLLSLHVAETQTGVCYGMIGNNLPLPQDVVKLYQSNGIKTMRLYSPDKATLQALQGTNDIKLMLGVPNKDVPSLARCQCAANLWVQANVIPYRSVIGYIVVGNEIDPSDQEASFVARAMNNIRTALDPYRLNDQIKISIAINLNLITNSYPPSNGQFKDLAYITPIINFLNDNNSPLMVNVYPYFAYISDPQHISLDYALSNAPNIVFTDPNNGLGYQSLFDAMVDSVYAALKKAGGRTTRVVASETGWPSRGGSAATTDNARTYYTKMIDHVKHGTPLTSWQPTETYLFAMFDENQKQGADTEQNFGLFYPTQQPKYGKLYF